MNMLFERVFLSITLYYLLVLPLYYLFKFSIPMVFWLYNALGAPIDTYCGQYKCLDMTGLL